MTMDNADGRRTGYLDRTGHDTSWMADAACRGLDPELFYPTEGGPHSEALAVCGGCPVQHRCLLYAVEADEVLGMWGGASQEERKRLAERHRRSRTRTRRNVS